MTATAITKAAEALREVTRLRPNERGVIEVPLHIVDYCREALTAIAAALPATDAECEEMAKRLLGHHPESPLMRAAAALLRRPRQTADAAEMRERWRPIETAPKGDGDEGPDILLTGPRANPKKPTWIESGHWYRTTWTPCFMDSFGTPTHWMPLPLSPAPQEADNGQLV